MYVKKGHFSAPLRPIPKPSVLQQSWRVPRRSFGINSDAYFWHIELLLNQPEPRPIPFHKLQFNNSYNTYQNRIRLHLMRGCNRSVLGQMLFFSLRNRHAVFGQWRWIFVQDGVEAVFVRHIFHCTDLMARIHVRIRTCSLIIV